MLHLTPPFFDAWCNHIPPPPPPGGARLPQEEEGRGVPRKQAEWQVRQGKGLEGVMQGTDLLLLGVWDVNELQGDGLQNVCIIEVEDCPCRVHEHQGRAIFALLGIDLRQELG